MPLPQRPKRYHERDFSDRAVEEFARLETPTQSDLNKVTVSAQIQAKIDAYRAKAKHMTPEEFEAEKHRSSRLADFLGERPHPLCHAHAIVSGGHPEATAARAILEWLEMRIDDPHNGCWLPENTAAKQKMPQRLKNAVPHSRIHRRGYYFWINTVISIPRTTDIDSLITVLREIETKLQSSTMPSYVMLTAAQLRKSGMFT